MAGSDPDRPLLVRVGRTKPVRWIDRRMATRRVGKAIAWSMIAGLVVFMLFVYENDRVTGVSRDDPTAVHFGLGWLVPYPGLISFTLIVGGGAFALFLFVVSDIARRGESADEERCGEAMTN